MALNAECLQLEEGKQTTMSEEQDKLMTLREPEVGLVHQIDEFVESSADIVAQAESLVPTANDFQVTTEAEMQFADDYRIELELTAKGLDERRLNLTRPLDDLKAYIMSLIRPAIDANKSAAEIYKRKVLAYRAEQRRIAEEARREAERIQRETQARLEAEARKKEEAAQKLKTEAARQRKLEEAESLRLAAQNTPVSLAVSAPAPSLSASNAVMKWYWKIENWPAFCKWLGDHPEWLNERGTNAIVVGPKLAAMNRLASQIGDTMEIPGVMIWSEEDLRKRAAKAQ